MYNFKTKRVSCDTGTWLMITALNGERDTGLGVISSFVKIIVSFLYLLINVCLMRSFLGSDWWISSFAPGW